MWQILMAIVILLFAIEFIRIIVQLLTLGVVKKTNCKACSGEIDSSLLKCNLCGTFLEVKSEKINKFSSYVEKISERKLHRVIKKINFWHGDYK
jgi:Holliday junction resolvase-like predicted endonuclease